MARYERASLLDAPLDDVWAFHSRVEGLTAVTPDWMGMQVESVVGPDGEADPEVLAAGSEVTLSVRPFGVGPRQSWTSRIVERERTDDEAFFVDRMVNGPFARWEHTHRFTPTEGGTRLHDRVDWALPGGPLGRLAAHVGVVGLAPMFRHRHRATRSLLAE